MHLNSWQRIDKIIRWSEFSSINAFAKGIGLNRGENLYQIKKGKNGISKELADKISSTFPEINKAWILLGEGDMLVNTESKHLIAKDYIPFYERDVVDVITAKDKIQPSYSISLPMFSDAEFAALSYSNAMTPSIPNGSIVMLSKASREQLSPGEEYFIQSPQFTGIRRVRRDSEEHKIRLEPRNTVDYDDILLDTDSIKQLYIIRGVIIKR